VAAKLVLVGGYEALDLAFQSVHGRVIRENKDEGVESQTRQVKKVGLKYLAEF